MCGIVGYVGDKSAVASSRGLKRLGVRGYDSRRRGAPPVLFTCPARRRRIKMLEGVLTERPLVGALGIGHTRWAPTAVPLRRTPTPHDCDGTLVVVHNGIIENYWRSRTTPR